ncbi:hypothetical protein SAMN05443572_10364 [Myxococcus fulvus]|uniref:Uncharacterized protein n=1 Tax=Myxococcus fulvus TaxID=33 RepID=A0A511TG72_MYXFU|nr:hypothetical protein [Myxococcus fulvus]AKF86329.1 hypothetical protein MFUL124B02_24855 [Myxococcus fulvus 124B02]GEN12382.1 hypothetical protein MFU01_74190 [Myxococcus fulvus]SET75174.1 hypothetical protein SAMN05443572_10364 [Myxococcus fulvus]
MNAQVLHGWLPSLTTALGCAVGCWLAVSQAQQSQQQRVEQLTDEVGSLRRALEARAHAAGAGLMVGASSTVVSGQGRLSGEELDAMALRVATLLNASGGPVVGPLEPEVQAPSVPELSSEQRESATRVGTMVDRVVSNGRMTAQDVLEIRRELAHLRGRPEADALRKKLIVAINQDRLIPAPDADGLP